MEINNYFNQLRQMFESDLPQDTNNQNSKQDVDTSIQNTNTQKAEADWQGFTTEVDTFISQVSSLKDFFQGFVNTNSSRTDENGKNALNLANKYLNEAVDIEQTLNKAKQTISASTSNELQTLKNAMDEAEKAFKEVDVNLEEKNNQSEEVSKNNTEVTNPSKDESKDDNSSSSETAENPEQGEDKSKQNTEENK
jgi:hypothetical protein